MNVPALKARQMAHFHLLSREEQEQAIRRLANAGYAEQTISAATQLSVEMIKRVLAEPKGAT
jgi:hypothetical protein